MSTLKLILIFHVLLTSAPYQDDLFEYHDVFGNLKDVPKNLDNEVIENSLWNSLEFTIRALKRPIAPSNSGYSFEDKQRWIMTARLASVLNSMLELRAFTNQNNITEDNVSRKSRFIKLDLILQNLGLHYRKNEMKQLVDFCQSEGVAKLEAILEPLAN